MGSYIAGNGPLARIGIAISTAMGAAIIGTDIDTLDATATGSLTRIFFGLETGPEKCTELEGIDAMGLLNTTFFQQKFITAGLQPNAMGIRQRRQL